MAKLKAVSANCPSCGAALPVMPGVPSITCRYCNNVIHVELRQPPPHVTPFGLPGGMPSTTLYLSPQAIAQAQKMNAAASWVVVAIIAFTVIIPLVIGLGASVGGGCVRMFRPYPIKCGLNDKVTVKGDWNGTGPVLVDPGINCKLTVKDAKITAPIFTKSGSNLDLTIENSTIETTDAMFKFDGNVKLHLKNATLKSQGSVVEAGNNVEIDLEGSSLESVTGSAIRTKYNLKVRSTNSKIRGKKIGIDTDSNAQLELKGTEITGLEDSGVKSTSNTKIESQTAKITGGDIALVGTSNMVLTGAKLTITSQKAKALEVESNLKIELADSSITSGAEEAIVCSSSAELVLQGTTIQGTTGLETQSGLKIRAMKKSRIVGTTSNGVTTTSGADVTLVDSSIEGEGLAFKSTSGVKVKLQNGARVAGKRGGIIADSSFKLDAPSGSSVEGGAGAGISATSSADILLRGGVLKGTPALNLQYRASQLDLAGTRVEGAQTVGR